MGEETEKNKINYEKLTVEEKRLLDKIQKVKESKELQRKIRKIKSQAENIGVLEVKDRIKEPASALNKYREKGYTDADRMGDIYGMMFITGDEPDIYEIAEYMKSQLSEEQTSEEDLVKHPRNGYRSYHMNSQLTNFSDLEGISVPLEVQIKTEPMSIAQDAIHDSLYKKEDMPKEIRNQLSTIMFPIIERMAQMDGFVDKSKLESKETIKKEVEQIKVNNYDILKKYLDVLRLVGEQYKNVIRMKKNEPQLQIQKFLDDAEMIEIGNKSNAQVINEFHDQKSEQFFESIKTGLYTITDFQRLAQTRRKETVVKTTNETIQGVRNNDQTKEKVTVGVER